MIEGNKISLRFISSQDVESIVHLFNEDDARAWGMSVRDPFVVAQCTAKPPHQREEGYLVILEKESKKVIGGLYYQLKLKHLQAFWAGIVKPPYRRNGVLTEAWFLLGKFLFDTFPIHKVESHVMKQNEASLAWCEKFGFTLEGTVRETWFCHGKLNDLVYVGILRDEFYTCYKQFYLDLKQPSNVASSLISVKRAH